MPRLPTARIPTTRFQPNNTMHALALYHGIRPTDPNSIRNVSVSSEDFASYYTVEFTVEVRMSAEEYRRIHEQVRADNQRRQQEEENEINP